LVAEISIHMIVNGKLQRLFVPFKPQLNLTALSRLYDINIQGVAIQPCSVTNPPKQYPSVIQMTPAVRPDERLWIKAQRRGEICDEAEVFSMTAVS
jgi:hypothetical protein